MFFERHDPRSSLQVGICLTPDTTCQIPRIWIPDARCYASRILKDKSQHYIPAMPFSASQSARSF